jgi:hypothetical protein
MSHGDTEHQGAAAGRVTRQTAPFVEHQPSAHFVASDQAVDGDQFPGLLPGHFREVGIVVAGVILERAQQLLVEGVPESEFDGGRAIRPVVEITQDRLAVTAFGSRCQAKENVRPNGGHQGLETIGRQAVALIHHHDVPVVGAVACRHIARHYAVDGGKDVIESLWLGASGKQLAKGMVAQHFTIGPQRLLQYLLPMGHEQQSRLPTLLHAETLIVEGGHDGLTGAGGGDDKITPAIVIPFNLQLIEHFLLIGFRLKVKIGGPGNDVFSRLPFERLPEGGPVCRVGGVVALEFVVFPEHLEVRTGTFKQIRLTTLGEFHRPL